MKNITWLAPKAGLGWYDHIGVVMRLTDQYVFLPESSQKVKRIKSHEKDTTVAWGYHKDVIIDIIIKTIIIHNIFFYNLQFFWRMKVTLCVLCYWGYIHWSLWRALQTDSFVVNNVASWFSPLQW